MAPAAALLYAVLAPAVAAAKCTSPGCHRGSQESVLLQMRAWQREAELGAAAAGGQGGGNLEALHRLVAGCQGRCEQQQPATRLLELARNVARSVLERPENANKGDDVQVLSKVLKLLEDTIFPGFSRDHAEDQREVELHAEYVGECVKDFDVANVNITAGQGLVQKQRDELDVCRRNVTEADERQQTLCDEAAKVKVPFDCGLPPVVPPYSAIQALLEWSLCTQRVADATKAAQPTWQRCQDAREEHKALAEKCEDLAAVHNKTICLVREETVKACRTFTSCHVKSLYRYDTVKASVAYDEEGRKLEVLAFVKATCYLHVVNNASALSHDEMRDELGRCDAIEEANATKDFEINYPRVHGSSKCAAKVIDKGDVQCETEVPIDLSKAANCAFGSVVFLRGVSGKLLQEAGGAVNLAAGEGEPAQWTLLNSSASYVYLASKSGQHLQDLNSERVSVSYNVLDWEMWSLEDAGEGKVRLKSHFGNYLEDAGGKPGLSSQRTTAAAWGVEHSDGSGPACDRDCAVGDWSTWGVCSSTCGGGQQSRAREVTAEAAHDGKECPSLTESQKCNEQACPVDCVVADWSEWGSCSATCGGGEQSRAREATTEAAHGGKECPGLTETQKCNEQQCNEAPTTEVATTTATGPRVGAEVNVAVGRPVEMSCGPYAHYDGHYATDNSTCNAMGREGCGVAHTCHQHNAWIEVDMQEAAVLERVVIWNGWEHCCRDRINPFVVRLRDMAGNEVWSSDSLSMVASVVHEAKNISVSYSGAVRYVRVQLDGHADYLHVAEIQAFRKAATTVTVTTTMAPTATGSGGKFLWQLGMNIHPSDGHDFGWRAEWDENVDVGSAEAALSADYLSSAVWAKAVGYVAIARHNSRRCEAAKIWRLKESSKSMLEYFQNLPAGRMIVSEAMVYAFANASVTLPDHGEDPIFGVDGELAFNWWYSNNGARIALDGGHLSCAGCNDDDTHGLGNEFGADTRNGHGSGAWTHDVANVQGDCHGGSCKIQGTDHGSHLRSGPVYGQYAIYVMEASSGTTPDFFPCKGAVHLSPSMQVTMPTASAKAPPPRVDAEYAGDDINWARIWGYSGGSPGAISVWRPSRPGFCSLGDVIVRANAATIPAGTRASFISTGYGRAPVGFKWRVAENQAGGINFWEPLCEAGYVSLGHVGVQRPEVSKGEADEPSPTSVCCAPRSIAQWYKNGDGVTRLLWSDPGTGGMDNSEHLRRGLRTFISDGSNCAGRFSPPCYEYAAGPLIEVGE